MRDFADFADPYDAYEGDGDFDVKSKSPVWTFARAQADIVFCSSDALQKSQTEKQAYAYVWPEEGEFLPNGDWKFNEEHAGEYEPLLVDINTVNLFLSLRERLAQRPNSKGENGAEVFDRRLKESRGYFALAFDVLWRNAKFKAI